MSIKDDLTKARIKALKEKDNVSKTLVGYILSAIKQFEVDNRKEATDTDIITVIKMMINQRQKAISEFSHIKELVDKETVEVAYLQQYLPVQASEEEVLNMVKEVIQEVKSNKSVVVVGDVMPILKKRLHGKADMGKVKTLVDKELV
jgi:hypothetical protein